MSHTVDSASSPTAPSNPSDETLAPVAGTSTGEHGSAATPTGVRKHFVLDTNVLLHNPSSIFKFAEHEVVIPLTVIE